MRRIPRWAIYTVVVVLIAAAGLAGLSVATVRRSFPVTDGQLGLGGLNAPVEVLRDAHGVVQIYADDAEDLFQAQGYVQAQDRFYEMDVRRHITAGRLSELFGKSQVETDSYLRTLGWHRVAEQELPLLSASTRRYLDAYAAGVNAYLRGRSASEMSLEYSLLGLQGLDYTPEDWTAADSLAWLKAMAWDLGSNLSQETELAIMSAKVGPSRAAELFPPYPLDGFDPIVTRGTVVGGRFEPSASAARARPAPVGPTTSLRGRTNAIAAPQGSGSAATAGIGAALQPWLEPRALTGELGSNSWVIAGSRTTTGKPLLGNDPHVTTSIPSLFSQVGLHCRTVSQNCPFELAGYSMAGLPGIVIGHNADISWGLTTSYVDAQDLYLERVSGNAVQVGDRTEPLSTRVEQIRVRGEDTPRTITVRSTKHGPLLSDVDPTARQVGELATPAGRPAYAVALAWTALTPSRSMDGLMQIAAAKNFAQFRAGAALVTAPSQNLVYADTAGHIGYQLMGAVPNRNRGNGLTPARGWDAAYDWKGLVPFAQLPYVYDPPAGYIVAANQQIIGRQYPHHIGSDYSYGWRSQELRDTIADAGKLSPAQAENLFYDDTIRFAADLVPVLLKVNVSDPWIREGQQTLVGWDYSSGRDSAAAAYFNIVFHDILKRTFRDEMPQDLWPTGGDRWYAVVATLLKEPRNRWWDDTSTPDKVERRDDILLAAMTDARKEATSLMSRDTSGWAWGRIHRVTLKNQTLGTSGIAPVERLFNRGDDPVPGGPGVVNAMGFDLTEGYGVTYGPTMRMLVDLSDLDKSRWVNQSGNSGHAYHPNYDDQLPLWVGNQLLAFPFTREAIEPTVTQRLQLVPTG
ncbi:penicillin acylase family protein [Microlunatus ginsengisoli]|uniref:Penicillin acylase family protein n=1 Tax=Microlunatus ginsengisoli TaxID=363863 RepID=A0ABP7AVP4_9ACTN